jgi:hypothetical protein
MQNLARASCLGGTRAPTTNRANSLEEILSNEVVMAGFSRRNGLCRKISTAARHEMLAAGKVASQWRAMSL